MGELEMWRERALSANATHESVDLEHEVATRKGSTGGLSFREIHC